MNEAAWEAWEEAFEPSLAPLWLKAFAERPEKALNDLLFRRFHHGALQAAEPVDLLIQWLSGLGDTGDFASILDQEAAAWIERHWGGAPPAKRVKRWADAWKMTCHLTAVSDKRMPRTAARLRARFDQAAEVLKPFSTSSSRNPYGTYLWAVANHQNDRGLEPFWWSLCDVQDVAFYQARFAVDGIAGLPAPEGERKGAFPEDVVHAVLRIGRAMDRLQRQGRLNRQQAKRGFGSAIGRGMLLFPFLDQWREIIAPIFSQQPEPIQESLLQHVVDLGKATRKPIKKPPFRNWREPTDRLVHRLRRDVSARSEATAFLSEARALAMATGESTPLNRALCRFSSAVAERDPELAATWAEEALAWEPWDAFSWTTLLKAQLRGGRLQEAELTAWRAKERFPENGVARNGLGEVLKAQNRLDEAEETYRETVKRFPSNVVASTGLGEVLKAQNRLDEAEETYRETVKRFPSNVVARNGLGEVLKAQNRLDEAEETYRETVKRFPENVVARTGLGEVLKAQNRLDEAEEAYRETVKGFPENVIARNGLGEVLKAQNRLDEAEETYRETVKGFPENVVARNGLKGVLKARNEQIDEAPFVEEAHPESASTEATPRQAEMIREGSILPASIDLRTRRARQLRRAALRPDTDTAELRQKAQNLLDEVLAERLNDSRALTEKGLLLIDSGAHDEALAFLAEHAERLPAVALLRTALARAVREHAKKVERLLGEGEAEMLKAPDEMREIDYLYEPLVRLQKGRGYLALTDGAVRVEKAKTSFDRLRKWTLQHQSENLKEFEPWYSSELKRYVFADIDLEEKIQPKHVETIDACIEANARTIDTLEDEFVLRFT